MVFSIRRVLVATFLLVAMLRGLQTVVAAAALGLPGLVGGDFIAYETAGRIVDQGDILHLYDLDLQQQVGMAIEVAGGVPAGQYFRIAFDNPPPVALLFALLALVPPAIGLAIWTIFNVACTFFVVWLFLRELPVPRASVLLTMVLGLLLFWPDFLGFFYGQMMGLVLLLYALTAYWLQRRRDVAAGIALALLAALKPQYALLLLLIVGMQWRRRSLPATFLAGSVLALISLGLVGLDGLKAYIGEIGALDPYAGNGTYLIDPGAMINWRAFLLQFFPGLPASAGFLLTNALAVATIIVALVVWRRAENRGHDPFGWPFLVVTAATLLATYHSHIHGAMLLLVPYLLLQSKPTPAFRGLVVTVFWPPAIALALLGPAVFALRPELSLYVMLWLVVAMLLGWYETATAVEAPLQANMVGQALLATQGGTE